MLNALISYYRSCYQADYRAISLLNFYSSKAENPLVLKSADLLQGKLLEFPVSTAWGEKTKQGLSIYSKEKELYCCSFFVFGKATVAGRQIDMMAPLFLHAVELKEEEDIFYVSIDAENPIINSAILHAVSNVETGLLENLTRELPKGFIQFDQLFELERVLKEFFPNMDISKIDEYPKLWNASQLKQFQKEESTSDQFTLIPACGITMLQKPSGSRGILNELEKMIALNDFSDPIHEVFDQKKTKPTSNKIALTVPIVLSKSQEDILKSAFTKKLNLVIGPPGTGKSFTIAALAVELMSKNKSVLIASKNNQAGNVVADKIEKDFGLDGVVVRAGKKDYKKILQKRLENLLNGIGLVKTEQFKKKKLSRNSSQLYKELNQLEKEIELHTQEEIKRGSFLYAYQASFFQKIKMYFLKRSYEGESPLWEKMFLLEHKLVQRNKSLRKLIQFCFYEILNDALYKSRTSLKDLVKALRARTGNKKESIFEDIDFKKVFKALPIWVANSTDIHRVLPLAKNLFDVVIIDEATQCDIASSLPILQRGKSAVIVGDPKQLRHISFLSKARQLQLIEEHQLNVFDFQKLDYRNNSILDVVSDVIESQAQVHFLNEHYRSMPDIIQFSNKYFYDNQLDVMSACPATVLQQHAFLHRIEGKRVQRGYNQKEAIFIFEKIRKMMDEEYSFPNNLCQSIGILSPFKDQVNYIQRTILKYFTAEDMERHHVLIGTPYAFQGEEKDVMFLSFALDDDSHGAAFNYLNREDVFNVSITRARTFQHVLISFSPKKIKQDALLARYVYSLRNNYNNTNTNQLKKESSIFLEEVVEAIRTFGIEEIHIGFPIAGTEIDIVVVKNGKTYCIDLVGYPSEFEEALPLERWRMLERVGLSTFTLPFSAWYFDKEKCINALKKFLNPNL
ncbi:MAG: AAA domain-containing protein [Bacteroidota bacterium]